MSAPGSGGANLDAEELARFEALSTRWWDADGEFRPLHDINPLRIGWIAERAALAGARVLDVGCGGGLACEALARAGARVTGIDAGRSTIAVARLHRHESGLDIDYRRATAEELLDAGEGGFDVVTCLELLEHVPDPGALVAACARLARPGGALCFSTINRTVRAYALAILGAEHLLGLLPRGTHDYGRLIRPSELAGWCRAAGLEVLEIAGVGYNPLLRRCSLSADVGVNYMLHASRDD